MKGSDRMKKIINKSVIFGIMIGMIMFGSLIYASGLYNANDIAYHNENSNVTNVHEAIDELYEKGFVKVFEVDTTTVPPEDLWTALEYKKNTKTVLFADIRGIVPNYTDYTIDNFIIQLQKTRTYKGTDGYFNIEPVYEYLPELGFIRIKSSGNDTCNIAQPYNVNTTWENGIKIALLK